MTQRDFSVSLQRLTDEAPASATVETWGEEQVLRSVASGPVTRYSLQVSQDLNLPPPQVESLNPEVFSVNPSGLLKVSNGTGVLRVTGYAGVREFPVDFRDPTPPTTYSHLGFQGGSLAAHCTANVLARIQGKAQGGETQNIYIDGGTHRENLVDCFTEGFNPNSILAGVDIDCISFSRNNPDPFVLSRHRFPGILVGPRHIIGAFHCIPTTGQRVIWRRSDGSFVEANVVRDANLGGDMGIAMLDRDITGIAFGKLLPPNYRQKLRAGERRIINGTFIARDRALLAFGITSNTSPNLGFVRHAQVFGVASIGTVPTGAFFDNQVFIGQPKQPEAQPFYSLPYGGDSGSPLFLLIDQAGVPTPVFIGSLYTATSAPTYPEFSPMAAQRFNEWGPQLGYSAPFNFQYADLSAFPDIPA